jgi:hypothetical protein
MCLLFHPTTPVLPAATISKMPLKPPRPSSAESTGVGIPNAKMLIEYDAVALELVREHLLLTENLVASATSPVRL